MLTRFKTFVATGVATAGRLYAGDLNAIQDAVASQSDYAQRVDAATFGIGESALALSRYGSGEARLTGSIRMDAIVRALGGLFAGQFTTAQRNAIPTGSRPYGLVIWNSDSSTLEKNVGTDASPNWQPIGGARVEKNGAGLVSEGILNLIEGAGITITVVDNPGAGAVDVTIAAPPAAQAGLVPIGGFLPYGGGSDPTNFLICDGRAVNRVGTYAALFGVIGTGYGAGNGSTTYNIPDGRGRAMFGVGGQIVAVGSNDGVAAGVRGPSHHHTYQAPLTPHGGYTETGQNPGAQLDIGATSGGAQNLDASSYFAGNWIIRYQ
jgi:microcystin-dependent protein